MLGCTPIRENCDAFRRFHSRRAFCTFLGFSRCAGRSLRQRSWGGPKQNISRVLRPPGCSRCARNIRSAQTNPQNTRTHPDRTANEKPQPEDPAGASLTGPQREGCPRRDQGDIAMWLSEDADRPAATAYRVRKNG
jgi:hypothetical protein